ncbi:MAG: hypothetical protein R3A13_02740 [Bdellovibrionota bacterium]
MEGFRLQTYARLSKDINHKNKSELLALASNKVQQRTRGSFTRFKTACG